MSEQLLPKRLEGVDHPRVTRKLAEGDQPGRAFGPRFAYALVVEEADAELEDLVEQGAVLLLALDDVSEEQVCLARQEPGYVWLLHSQNHVAR